MSSPTVMDVAPATTEKPPVRKAIQVQDWDTGAVKLQYESDETSQSFSFKRLLMFAGANIILQ